MWQPLLWRTLVTAPSSKALLQVAASRRASPHRRLAGQRICK